MVMRTIGNRRRAQSCALAVPVLIGVWLLGLSRLAAQIPQVDTTPITSVAQDSAGTIWATGQLPGSPPDLFRWQGDHWVDQPARPSIPGELAQGVWPGPRGGLIVAWNSPGEESTVFTWQRGDEVKILGSIKAVTTQTGPGTSSTRFFESPEVITTSSGEILITGDSPDIYTAEPGGSIRLAYTIQPGQYRPHRQFLNLRSPYLPLRAIQDAQGRTWIWSGLPARVEVSGIVLRGFLLFDGKGFDYHAQIPGLPSGQVTCLGRWDKNHLAVGTLNAGLYTIDTSTLTAQRMTDSEPGAFRFVQQAFYQGANHYVIASTFGLPQAESPESGPFNILWRFRDKRWEKLVTGLDEVNDFSYQPDRPRLQTSEGLWLGGWARGLWFIPSADREHVSAGQVGKPLQINWKQRFPLDTARRLFGLKNGSILAVDFSPGRTVEARPISLLAGSPPVGNVKVINPFTMMEPDQRLRFWSILKASSRALDEWNGEKWTAHPLPGNINPAWLSGLDADSEGRVWLFPDCRMGPMAIFDPHQDKWADYPSYQVALATHGSRPVRFLHPDDDRMKPIYGPRSQIVYNGACQGINYFDGTDWHVWNRREVPGDPGYFFDGPAFFDAAGHVAVNIHQKTREWGPEQGWQFIPYVPHNGQIVNFFVSAPPGNPPSGCSSTQSSSLARDPLGRFWWTWDGSLYEGIPGRCLKPLSASQPQPFIDSRLLRRVLTDWRGNVFLETISANGRIGEYVILFAPGPIPHTTIHLTKLSPESVSAEFQSSISSGAVFTWRLDGGDWSAPVRQRRVILRSLAGGEHSLEAASIDSLLQMDAVPASVSFDIAVKPQDQIPALIARLEHAQSDDERKAAIEALARQPASTVLPALKAARAHASGDELWWIDAAIQEVIQHAHQSGPAGNER